MGRWTGVAILLALTLADLKIRVEKNRPFLNLTDGSFESKIKMLVTIALFYQEAEYDGKVEEIREHFKE